MWDISLLGREGCPPNPTLRQTCSSHTWHVGGEYHSLLCHSPWSSCLSHCFTWRPWRLLYTKQANLKVLKRYKKSFEDVADVKRRRVFFFVQILWGFFIVRFCMFECCGSCQRVLTEGRILLIAFFQSAFKCVIIKHSKSRHNLKPCLLFLFWVNKFWEFWKMLQIVFGK